ncbi:MAG TPA: phosphoadenosine phosphosulfate reductase family protein [Ktedonobacteraceae bacterium]|nr:phosphoadenosine phosphosulfate reductase family protein [Ktedonobacteraceae bacterium]
MDLNHCLHVVSVSGGKDSTALYCWAIREFGRDGFKAVFADTGHEHPVTLNYLRNLPEMAEGPPIHWVKADFSDRIRAKGREPTGNPFLDLMLWKGRAPSSKAQFCTEHLKMAPIRAWIESIRMDNEVYQYVGIRAGESPRRAKMTEIEFSNYYDCWFMRPLLRWSETDVFGYLKACGVPPNPLYGTGFRRVGCFPCIHAVKSELSRLPEWAWKKLADWEKKLGRTWFPPNLVPGIHLTTIDDARRWCRTKRGGRELDLELPDAKDVPSCMATWGVCE